MKYSDLLKTMTGCPFCDLKRAGMITENKTAFLTYSLAPYHPDHLLVIPKRHVELLLEMSDEEMKDINTLQKQAIKILKNIGYVNISLLVREGDSSGKSVPHLHYHAVPEVRLGDLDHKGEERIVMTEGEIKAVTARIKGTGIV